MTLKMGTESRCFDSLKKMEKGKKEVGEGSARLNITTTLLKQMPVEYLSLILPCEMVRSPTGYRSCLAESSTR